MAEPARKLPEDPRDHSWQPRVIAGGGEGGGERGNLHSVPQHSIETPAEEATRNKSHLSLVPALKEAENQTAEAAGTRQNGDLASRENEPNYYYKPRVGKAKEDAAKAVRDAKQRSTEYRQKGGRNRGVLIGLGAGGGLLSVVAGFTALLPLKMPGILDGITGDAGKRVEKVIERRAERVVLAYLLSGSKAALKGGNYIVTGNPIGDLFANIRTSSFERDLLQKHGLAIEPDGNGRVKLIHNSKEIWSGGSSAKNTDAILKILDEGKALTRANLRTIVRAEIPAWRFWKRAKFVKWLVLKYNIPRLGVKEQEANQTDEEYNKEVKKEHIQNVETGNLQNVVDFVDCAADAGDCPDKVDEGSKMTEQVEKAAAEAAEDLAEEGTKKASSSVFNLIISKLTASSASAAIPYIGWIDMGARMVHGLGEIIESGLLQKKHAQYIKTSSAVLAVAYAAYADQTKAGDMQTSTVGMFTENLDGWEESASYGIIQASAVGGEVKGQMLEPMERTNEDVDAGTFGGIVKTMFGTVGWIGRAPLEAWFYTVSKLFDLGGDGIGWILEKTNATALLAQLAPAMGDIFTGLMKLMGMHVDPLETGPRLALFIHQGFLGTFNDKAKEDGMRLLTEEQGLAMDQDVKNDRIADMQNESLFTRVFDVNNEQSLATNLVATLPSDVADNPISSLANAGFSMVKDAPTNLANITTPSAHAAVNRTSESLFGQRIYAGLPGDLAANLDDGVVDKSKECPPISDKAFNHCIVDRGVVDSMNCVFVKCPDMYDGADEEATGIVNNSLFAYGAEGPKYGSDAVPTKPKYDAIALDWHAAGGLLAATLPIGALEVSRRRQV